MSSSWLLVNCSHVALVIPASNYCVSRPSSQCILFINVVFHWLFLLKYKLCLSRRWEPWPGGPVGWSVVLYTRRLWVQSPVRAHAWVVGLTPSGSVWRLTMFSHVSVSLSLSLKISFKNVLRWGFQKRATGGSSTAKETPLTERTRASSQVGPTQEDGLLCPYLVEVETRI